MCKLFDQLYISGKFIIRQIFYKGFNISISDITMCITNNFIYLPILTKFYNFRLSLPYYLIQ